MKLALNIFGRVSVRVHKKTIMLRGHIISQTITQTGKFIFGIIRKWTTSHNI